MSKLAALTGSRCSHILPLILLSVASSGCTSVRWRDGRGREHHLGLVAVRDEALARGRVLRRVAIGLDLRLSGEERGATVGAKFSDEYHPEVVVVEDAEQLADTVVEYLASEGTPEASAASSWSFFHYAEDYTEPTRVDSRSLGADLRAGPASPGASLGYARNRTITGPLRSEGVVQLHAFARADPDHEELVLWKLRRGEGPLP